MPKKLTPEAVEAKRDRERAVVTQMTATYCHGNHGTRRGELCRDCAAHPLMKNNPVKLDEAALREMFEALR